MELSEETKTLAVIHRHITLVKDNLFTIANKLQKRARNHDLSKLRGDELLGFIQINKVARKYPYGSDEYKAALEIDAVGLHYSRNDHHPEYFSDGVSDMNLFQLIEMVADWKAASETYGQTTFDESLRKQRKRFHLDDKQFYIIQLIAEALGEQ
jgi:hypothetical protein